MGYSDEFSKILRKLFSIIKRNILKEAGRFIAGNSNYPNMNVIFTATSFIGNGSCIKPGITRDHF